MPAPHCGRIRGHNAFLRIPGRRDMKTIIVAAVAALTLAAPAQAQERAGPAALGALSGAVVLGPVGLVAGAVIGYTAGPEIGRAWKVKRVNARHDTRRATRPAKRTVQASVKRRAPAASSTPGVVTPAPGVGGPPVQGLE
jgi:hypothetical protein